MKNLKNKKGITLVALVITIVVLLILAMITIKAFSDNGIIGKAKEAKNEYKNSAEKEQEYLTDQLDKIDIALNKIATGEAITGVTGMIRDTENGLIYKVIDENAKTAEAYGDRGDIDYTDSNWKKNNILTTGDIIIKSKVNIEGTTYNVIKVGDGSFGYSYYDVDPLTWMPITKNIHANINKVTIEEGIKIIGSAFDGCSSLNNLIIPNTVIEISSGAFNNTPWLTAQRQENAGLVIVGDGILFDGTTATGNVVVPSSVKRIDTCAFYNNTNITGLTISEGVIEIGDNAFSNCTNITNIIFPSTLKKIGFQAFHMGCKVQNVNIPANVEIVDGSFLFWISDGVDNQTITVNWKNGTKPEGWGEGWTDLPSSRIIINNIT